MMWKYIEQQFICTTNAMMKSQNQRLTALIVLCRNELKLVIQLV